MKKFPSSCLALTEKKERGRETQPTLKPVAKEHDPKADVRGLEREIDALVDELYGLTDGEIALVEGR